MEKTSSLFSLVFAAAARDDGGRSERASLKYGIAACFLFLFLPCATPADVGKIVGPLTCGIYDQAMNPFVRGELDTQNADRKRYTMETITKSGKRLTVLVKSVEIKMAGARDHVTVFLDGKPYAKTSHQDVPIYLEVHVDDVKYRIICVHADKVLFPGLLPGEEK
jgi:hypothetical protein